MRNFVIFLFLLSTGLWIADNVFASTLYDLYSDNSAKPVQQTTKTKTTKKTTTQTQTNPNYYNNNYMPDFSGQNQIFRNPENLFKQGSQNYGEYATKDRRTNPVRIGNPYNHLNNKYVSTPTYTGYSNNSKSSSNFDSDAVKFKRSADGNIYGYNKYGKKVGIYRLNNNGTTTQYDTQGNKMGTFK